MMKRLLAGRRLSCCRAGVRAERAGRRARAKRQCQRQRDGDAAQRPDARMAAHRGRERQRGGSCRRRQRADGARTGAGSSPFRRSTSPRPAIRATRSSTRARRRAGASASRSSSTAPTSRCWPMRSAACRRTACCCRASAFRCPMRARKSAEDRVTAQAIQAWRQRAASAARGARVWRVACGQRQRAKQRRAAPVHADAQRNEGDGRRCSAGRRRCGHDGRHGERLRRRGVVGAALAAGPRATHPMTLDPVLLSRLQFAFVIAFHILLPAFTIGLSAFIVAARRTAPLSRAIRSTCGCRCSGRRSSPSRSAWAWCRAS